MQIYKKTDMRIKLYLRQLSTALGPLLGLVISGMSNGYSAILLPQLKRISSNSSESLTKYKDLREFGMLTIDQESWIASAAILPMAAGCWTGGIMAEKLGRKASVLIIFPTFFIGWLIIGFANNVETLIAGRLLVGYCAGVLAPIVPIYVSETSSPLLRGVLLGAVSLNLSIGILACHAMGTWLHWRTTACICAVLPILCWIISIFSRESPTWLLGRDQIEQAKRTWIFFRGEQSLEEFFSLETSRLVEISKKKTRRVYDLRLFKKIWSLRYFLKSLAIVCLYFFITQFSGSNVLSFYCIEMLASVSGSTNAYFIMLVIDIIRLVFGILACILLKRYGRRTMTFLSGFSIAAIMLFLSACLTLDVGRPWSPMILLLIYVGLPLIGLIPVPWLLCGELFSRKYRGLGSGLASGFNFVCFFVVIKTMPAMIKFINPEGTFAVYGSVALIGTSILYTILPETKNKTLQEIQVAFKMKAYTPKVQKANVPFIECVSSKEKKILEK